MRKNIFLKIIISIFIIYTLAGFYLIPMVVKEQLIKNLDNLLITKTSIEKVFFNPYSLKIELEKFALKDKDKKLIGFDKLSIDFSLLKSIHESHISFKALNLVKPYINIVQNENGNINLASLLKTEKSANKETNKTNKDESLIPNFKITKTKIVDGNFLFTQLFNGKATTTNIHNFNYTFYELGTYKNSLASHNLVTSINKDTKLYVEGGFRLIPFKMYGKVKLENLKPAQYLGYSKDMLNFTIGKPSLNLDFGYRIDTSKDLILYVDNANLNLKDLKLIKNDNKIISLKDFSINDLDFDLKKQKITIEKISLDSLIAGIISDKNANLNIDKLINLNEQKEIQKESNKSESKPWIINLNSFALNNSNLSFDDLKSQLSIDVKDIGLNLKNISYDNEVKIDNTTITTKDILINDKNAKTNINAKNIDISVNNLLQNDKIIKLSSIDINEPFASIILEKNKSVKKEQNSKESKKKKSPKKEESNSAVKLDIGPINIKNGNLSFQDKNLPIPFKTDITKLNGKISELKSTSSKPSKLKLEGKIDKYGYTRITGIVDHKDIKKLTDINMIFKNIAIKNFTPYSGKFVGRKLDGGKLNLNLNYNIKKSNLDASNSIIITDIKLGDVVKSDDAMSLPLELGIALLEDSDGVIDLDIPIAGNLNDPQFSIAPIVWKAVTNLIVKAVSAPFSFLASILGISEDEINKIEFIYGESKLIDLEKETLDKIAKAFAKRPSIALKITGAYDKVKDLKALQQIKLEELLKEDMKKIKAEDSYLKALETRYSQLKEKTKLEDLKKRFIVKTKDKKESFDKDSYISFLKNSIVSTIPIQENELKELAQNRIKSIVNYLNEKHGIKENRIIVKDEIKILDEKDAKYAKFDLEIDIKKK